MEFYGFHGGNISVTITNHDTGETRTIKNVKVQSCECVVSYDVAQEIILHLVQNPGFENFSNYMNFFEITEESK